MDSSWGAPGGRGGLTIQELGGGEEISLNSFLSDISGEPIYADAEPIYDIVGEVEDYPKTPPGTIFVGHTPIVNSPATAIDRRRS